MTDAKALIEEYLAGLESADISKTLAVFTEHARVQSPLYGEISARDFYTDLFTDTARSRISLITVFYSEVDSLRIAAHFVYHWTLKNGSSITFDCVDLFDRDPASGKVRKLTIVYDTAGIRGEFDSMKSENDKNTSSVQKAGNPWWKRWF